MTRKLLVGAIAAGALAITAGTAFAMSGDDGPAPGSASVSTSLTDPTSTSSSTDDTPTSAPTSSSTSESPTSGLPTQTSNTPAPGGVQLTAEAASQIALQRFGGVVHEVEREYEHGRLEWKVELTASTGVTYDVRVDAATGTITRVEQDSRGGGDDDRGGDDHGGRHGGDDDRGGDDHGGRHGGDDH